MASTTVSASFKAPSIPGLPVLKDDEAYYAAFRESSGTAEWPSSSRAGAAAKPPAAVAAAALLHPPAQCPPAQPPALPKATPLPSAAAAAGPNQYAPPVPSPAAVPTVGTAASVAPVVQQVFITKVYISLHPLTPITETHIPFCCFQQAKDVWDNTMKHYREAIVAFIKLGKGSPFFVSVDQRSLWAKYQQFNGLYNQALECHKKSKDNQFYFLPFYHNPYCLTELDRRALQDSILMRAILPNEHPTGY